MLTQSLEMHSLC